MKKKYIYIGAGFIALAVAASIAYQVIKKKKNVSSGNEIGTGGKSLIGSSVYVGSSGYVNIRTSPKVDNVNVLSLDFDDNVLGKSSESPVGKIIKQVKGDDGYFWYEIELSKSIEGKTTGFVREDAVKF